MEQRGVNLGDGESELADEVAVVTVEVGQEDISGPCWGRWWSPAGLGLTAQVGSR